MSDCQCIRAQRPVLYPVPVIDDKESEMWVNVSTISTIQYGKDQHGKGPWVFVSTLSGALLKFPGSEYEKILQHCEFAKSEVPQAFHTAWDVPQKDGDDDELVKA